MFNKCEDLSRWKDKNGPMNYMDDGVVCKDQHGAARFLRETMTLGK